jgi:hypothetical protein
MYCHPQIHIQTVNRHTHAFLSALVELNQQSLLKMQVLVLLIQDHQALWHADTEAENTPGSERISSPYVLQDREVLSGSKIHKLEAALKQANNRLAALGETRVEISDWEDTYWS